MNKHKMLHVWLLIISLFMVSCAIQRNSDSTIDACNLTKPPKEAIKHETHAANLLEYPATIADCYNGCQIIWISDFYGLDKHHLLAKLKFKRGLLSRVESFEPKEEKVTCEFDKNKSLIKGSTSDCLPYDKWMRSE